MTGSRHAPDAAPDPDTLSAREVRELLQEVAATRLQVRELNARLEEAQWVGWTVARLANRWGVGLKRAQEIAEGSGAKSYRSGRPRVWDVRDLPALDAHFRKTLEVVWL